MLKSMALRSTIVAFACMASASAFSMADAPRFVNVQAGELADALEGLANQCGVDVIYPASQLKGLRTRGVTGTLETKEAFQKLIEGTSLVMKDEGSAVLIMLPRSQAQSKSLSADRTWRLAQSPSSPGNGSAPTGAQGSAQSTSDSSGNPRYPVVLEEVTVTAQKRVERLIDIPLAVSAVRADQLTSSGAVRLEDFTAGVPGVSVANNSAGGVQTQVVFRGISTGVGGNPVASAYIDDAPITSATQLGAGGSFPDFDPADLERIEFLRGPQGTLYGAASLGGLVKYVTRKPDFEHLSGRAEVDFVDVDHGGAGEGARGRVNLPLSSQVALTASGFYRTDPGFIDNVLTARKDWNTSRIRGGRVALAIEPLGNITIQASVLHQRIDSESVATLDTDNNGTPLLGDLNVSRPRGSSAMNTRFTLYDLAINGHFDGFDAVSDTSFSRQASGTSIDYTRLIGGVLETLAAQPAGTLGGIVSQPFATRKFSQEARLQSNQPGFFGWQLGGFYTHESATTLVAIDPVTLPGGASVPASLGLPVLANGSVDATYQEVAGFGDATLNFTDELSLSGGLRYSHFRVSDEQTLDGIFLGAGSLSGASSDNKLTYSVNPVFKITHDLMVYGRIASGYRPGGPNITTTDPASYKPDTAVSYEMGTKGELLERTLVYDLSAFLINWNDIQIQQSRVPANGGPPLNYIANAGRARSQGVEAAVTFKPVPGLSIDTNIAYTDAHLSNTTSLAPEGARLPNSARVTGQFGGEYRFELQPDWMALFGASYRYVGRRLAEFTASAAVPRFVLPSYETIDLRTGVEHEGFELNLYLRNAADKRGYTGAFGYGPYTTVSVLQPRTVGLTLAKSF